MHRIENYQIRLLDRPNASGFPWLADLGTVHNFRYQQREFGQFGAKCTFSMASNDPWAAELNSGALHFLWVLRDGIGVFSGVQTRRDLGENAKTGEPLYDFEFIPLSMWLHYRAGLPLAGGTRLEINTYVDDAFKWIIERVLGATAPATPINSTARAWDCLSVAADKSEHPDTVELDATHHKDIYEYLQRRAVGYGIDWDIYFKLDGANIVPEFETWYPRRGSDRSETNTDGNRAIIFSDAMGEVRAQSYGEDTADMGTVFYNRDMSFEILAGAGEITNWLVRDVVVPTDDTGEVLEIARAEKARKKYYELIEFRETLAMQWVAHFGIGDLVTLNSTRMGYGPWDNTICGADAEIDEQGWEHLKLAFGDPRPDIMDKLRGGGEGADDPDYTKPFDMAWHLYGDTPTNVLPNETGGIGILGGAGITVVESAANHTLTLNTVWQRTAGTPNYLHQATHGDELRIYDAADGLAFRITGNGDVYGNAQQLGAPFRLFQIIDYDIVGATVANAGVHNITISGGLTSDVTTTASGLEFLGGTDGEDQVKFRNWQVFSDTVGATLRARYTITSGLQLFDTDGATVLFTVEPTAGSVRLFQGSDLIISADDGTTPTLVVDGATGNTSWAPGAKWTIETKQYTLPTAYPATSGMALIGTTAGVLTWGNPLIATPGTLTVSTVNAAAAPHTHAITTTAVGAASTILATDANSYTRVTRLELASTTKYVAGIDNNTWLVSEVGNIATWSLAGTYIYVAGAIRIGMTETYGYPGTTAVYAWGQPSYRFSNIYSVLGNFGGTVTITGGDLEIYA